MMRFSLAALLAAVEGRIVTVQQVTTAAPSTIMETPSMAIVTSQETAYVSETIFKASTIATTIPTGTVITSSLSSKPPPVSQTDSYSTEQLSETVNPSSYESGFTVVPPGISEASPSTTSGNSPSATASPSSSPSSSPVGSESSSTATASSSNPVATSSTPSSTGSVTTSSSGLWTASTSSSAQETGSSTTAASPSSSSAQAASGSGGSGAASGSSGSSGYSGPIFDAIDTSEPLGMFKREPIPLQLASGVDSSGIVQTNKFYDNLLLNGQNLTAFAQPYGVFYSTDETYYGFAVSYTNKSQRVFGPNPNANPVEYYTNPVGLMSLVFSAKEFTNENLNSPKVDAMGPFSANVTLTTQNCWPNQAVTVPVVQGMGLVTAIYNGYTPRLFSQLGIDEIVKVKSSNCEPGLQKFAVTLMNGVQWNVYVDGPDDFEFKAISDFEVMGNKATSGDDSMIVQVAVVPGGDDSAIDKAAGAFPVGGELDGEVGGSTGTYRISYDVRGKSSSGTTLLYALPHHVASFSGATQPHVVSDLIAYSTNKGYLTGVLSNQLEMTEDLSGSPDWLPTNDTTISVDTLKLLSTVLNTEISEDVKGQVDTTSTYTAGKAFDKFAYIALVAKHVLGNDKVAKQGLDKLKDALSPWLDNTQPTPFIYDTLCKGVTSSAANQPGGKPMDDFGAPFYNDHHFHYGYYVHTAAVIGLLDNEIGDGTWVQQHKDWVNSLVRDVANPSSDDSYFPVSRMFDFYSGHSWAHGMFESGDGKDEESTSEDYNFAYGMKMWGRVIGDHQMEARGDLMLAILRRSLNSYFLFSDGNSIEPSKILANRVAGITFENKLDHTTYFGTNIEYIQGIQMLPLTPASVLIRGQTFVKQEWDSLLANVVGSLDSGWAGVLRANQALFDPKASYQYFASDNFKAQYLDGGASRTWYLTFAAMLGGNPN